MRLLLLSLREQFLEIRPLYSLLDRILPNNLIGVRGYPQDYQLKRLITQASPEHFPF